MLAPVIRMVLPVKDVLGSAGGWRAAHHSIPMPLPSIGLEVMIDGEVNPTVDRGDQKGVNLRPGVLDVPAFLYYRSFESVETPG